MQGLLLFRHYGFAGKALGLSVLLDAVAQQAE